MEHMLFGYPAMLAGLAVGALAAWRDWPVWQFLMVGGLLVGGLVWHASGAIERCPVGAECDPVTPFMWAFIAVANVGGWMLGIGTGVAVVWTGRRRAS